MTQSEIDVCNQIAVKATLDQYVKRKNLEENTLKNQLVGN